MKPIVEYIPTEGSLLSDPFYAFLYGLWVGGAVVFNIIYWRWSK